MSNPDPNATRDKIIETVRANAPAIAQNLHSYWKRSFQDLRDGGIAQDALIESMFNVAMGECVALVGVSSLVEKLRDSADRVEQILFREAYGPPRSRH